MRSNLLKLNCLLLCCTMMYSSYSFAKNIYTPGNTVNKLHLNAAYSYKKDGIEAYRVKMERLLDRYEHRTYDYVNLLMNYAAVEQQMGEVDKAVLLLQQALETYESKKLRDVTVRELILYNLILTNINNEQLNQAINYTEKLKSVSIKNRKYFLVAECNDQLSGIAALQKNYALALSYQKTYYDQLKTLGCPKELSNAEYYNILANSLMDISQFFFALNQPDSSFLYLEKARYLLAASPLSQREFFKFRVQMDDYLLNGINQISLDGNSFLDQLHLATERLDDPLSRADYFREWKIRQDSIHQQEIINQQALLQKELELQLNKQEIELIKKEAQKMTLKAGLLSKGMGVLVVVTLLSILGVWYINKTSGEIRTLNTSLQRKQLQLEKSNDKLNNLVSIVSHDILSNLELILSTANVLVLPNKNESSLNKYFSQSQTIIHQLRGYCKDLLVTAREHNSSAPIDLNILLHELTLRYQSTLDEYGIQVQRSRLPSISIDRSILFACFQNLIDNAIQHVKGRENPTIFVEAQEQGDFWEISIHDNGVGIPEALRQKIFDSNTSFRDGGQGMGLYLVRQLIEKQGGKVWTENNKSGGASFYLTLKK